jgi:putative sigma-54 modulation protein
MQIDIQALNIALTDHLSYYVKRRLHFALSTRDENIMRVIVRLSDINGPKGGKDMCCHIQVGLKGAGDVVIKDVEENIYTAVDRAAGRAARTVARKLARKPNRQRSLPVREQLDSSSTDQHPGGLSL